MTSTTSKNTTGGFSDELGKWDLENGDQLRAVYRETRSGHGAIWILSREKGNLGWGSLEHAQGLVNKEAGHTIWGEPTEEEKLVGQVEELQRQLTIARFTLTEIAAKNYTDPAVAAEAALKVMNNEA